MQRVSSINNDILKLLKHVLWGTDIESLNDTVFEEAKKHSLVALPTYHLSGLPINPITKEEWKRSIFQQLLFHSQYQYTESRIPISVPYVILKGSSAAQYYPHPELRSMGDIDIMTRREDFDQAYQELIADGYLIISTNDREVELNKDGVTVELHKFFSSLSDIEAAKFLDDLIIDNISPSHVLNDSVNGLVLLEHISQHLENGIGLRQIIDWMLYVYHYLSEENWIEFQSLAKKIHLNKLAIVVTRMCEIYIGLPSREWSKNADVDLCNQLMEYVLACGNFGNKRIEDSDIIENVFVRARTPFSTFRLLQERGLANWESARKWRFLRPFAWLFQLKRYIIRGSSQEGATEKIIKGYKESRKRIAFFEELGVRQYSKRIAVYRNGKYVKD